MRPPFVGPGLNKYLFAGSLSHGKVARLLSNHVSSPQHFLRLWLIVAGTISDSLSSNRLLPGNWGAGI
jgi:hypothetical protein